MTYRQILPKCSLAGRRAIVKQGRDGGREAVIEEWAANLMGTMDIFSDPRPVVADFAQRIVLDGVPRSKFEDVESLVGCKVKHEEGGPLWFSKIYHVSELRLLDEDYGEDC